MKLPIKALQIGRCCGLSLLMIFFSDLVAAEPTNAHNETVSEATNVIKLESAIATFTIAGKVSEKNIVLPYAWDKEKKSESGTAVFLSTFSAKKDLIQPWAIYVEKVGNAYEVWLNNFLLQRQGRLDNPNRDDYSQLPKVIIVPANVLKSDNQLRIVIRADAGRKAGLSSIFVGPQDDILPYYERSHLVKATGSLLVCMFSLLTGSFALVLWLTQPEYSSEQLVRRSPLYFYAAIAELTWTFGVGYMFFEVPPLAWPWWGVLSIFAGVIWRCAMILFCLEVADWRAQKPAVWLRRWVYFLVIVTPCIFTLALVEKHPSLLTFAYLIEGITFIVFSLFFFFAMLRQPHWPPRLLAGALIFNMAVGLRDLYVLRIDIDYVSFTWLRFSSVLFGATLAIIILTRFRLLSSQSRDLASTLTARVRKREYELSLAWSQSELMVRQQERENERKSILRDMHDGVGSHISSAIRQLQSGKSTMSEVLLTLQDSLDQLKLSIDSMSQPAGDLNALLANLRYRLEPRLKASGIEMRWQVEKIPLIERLDPHAMRQLQFVFFEIFSNIMQHSNATVITVGANCYGAMTNDALRSKDLVCIFVEDNGIGFDVTVTQRRGLESMRQRVASLGCELVIKSLPSLTSVELKIVI